MEMHGAGTIPEEPLLGGLNRGLGERSNVAHGLMVWEM